MNRAAQRMPPDPIHPRTPEMDTPRPPPTLDFWYEFASPYSYLSVMRIGLLAAQRGVRVRWQPFLLGPVFQSLGWAGPPFVVQQVKGAYMWKDVERQARKIALPWRRPSVFPRRAVLPARIALLGADAPWGEAFAQAVMRLNFEHDEDVDDEAAMARLLYELGLPAGQVIGEAEAPAHRERLRAQTAQAQRLGLFGAPTFFTGGEMFWGDDRLEDALAHAVSPAMVE
jgi:2-hydroxychromene-2-carboxylate isomerase